MPIAEVLDPDGKTVHEFEVPEGATPAQIEDFAAKTIGAQKQKQVPSLQSSAQDAALSSGIDAVPFGSDIAAAFEAIKNGDPNKSFAENQAKFKRDLEEYRKAGEQQHPAAAIGGGIAGALATAPLIPAKALQGASWAVRAAKGTGVGSILGALHGAGEGEGVNSRLSNAVNSGLWGAVGGAAGSVAADTLSLGLGALAPPARRLAERAANLFKVSPEGQQIGDDIAEKVAQQAANMGNRDTALVDIRQSLDNVPQTPITTDIIPLTKGQATQNARIQSLENASAAGVHGEEAQALANQVREIQSDKAKQAISQIAGAEITPSTSSDAIASIVDKLKGAYQSAKAKTTAAYKDVGELAQKEPISIANDYIDNGIIPSFKDWAEKGSNGLAWDLEARGMENAKRLFQKAVDFTRQEETPSLAKNFFDLENWRSAVSQGIRDAATPSEKAFLSGMLQRYDTAMGQLPREAIKSGDEAILAAMEKARTSRKEQGVLFERSKLVRDIVQNDDLTNEQFANSILSLGPKAGSYVRDILRTASKDPAAKEELQNQIKQSILGSIVNKSLQAEVKAGGTIEGGIENMISFDKLVSNISRLTQNKTLLERAFPSEVDRNAIDQIYRAASLIKSLKPGTKNYSNTAYDLLTALRSVSPVAASTNIMGIGLGSALKAAGREGAVNELTQSLAPVLKDMASGSENTITNFGKKYGRQVFASEFSGASNRKADEVNGQ